MVWLRHCRVCGRDEDVLRKAEEPLFVSVATELAICRACWIKFETERQAKIRQEKEAEEYADA